MYITLLNDGCEDLYTYINWMNLSENYNAIVLPATSYHYHIPEDLEDTEVLVNLKPLNLFEDLGSFLSSVLAILPEYSYFTGFLENYANEKRMSGSDIRHDNDKIKQHVYTGEDTKSNGKPSFLRKKMQVLYKNCIKGSLTKEGLKSLLDNSGFKVLDITVLNGKTFFYVQKQPSSPDAVL